jgi:hypothetical protein
MARIKPVTMAMRFALVGCLISVLFFSFWRLDEHFDFFNLPTLEQARTMGNYSQPVLRAFLEKLNFILCPPYAITSFAGMDLGRSANLVLWLISLVLNAALYFVLGLIFGALWNRVAQRKLRAEL